MIKYEKVIRDGKVAVLYSPGYGSGWSTYAPYIENMREACIFDSRFVELVETNKRDQINVDFLEKLGYESMNNLGAHQLQIYWLPVATRFSIHETGGYEYIFTVDDLDYQA